jgi:hypothetical protein
MGKSVEQRGERSPKTVNLGTPRCSALCPSARTGLWWTIVSWVRSH